MNAPLTPYYLRLCHSLYLHIQYSFIALVFSKEGVTFSFVFLKLSNFVTSLSVSPNIAVLGLPVVNNHVTVPVHSRHVTEQGFHKACIFSASKQFARRLHILNFYFLDFPR